MVRVREEGEDLIKVGVGVGWVRVRERRVKGEGWG